MREGYKDSPLGEIPVEWDVVPVSSIGEVTSSKRVHKADYTTNGIPFFRGKEITQLAKNEKLNDIVYIKEESFDILKDKFGSPIAGDVLITAVGTIGSIYLVKDGDEFYFKDGNLMWIRKITDKLNKRFLMHYMRSHIFQNLIDVVSSGSSQKALTIVKFKRLYIPILAQNEQQKIAEILSTVDEKIEVIDQQITETQALKKGLMQSLLTKGIGHTEFKDSPLGEIPKSWEVVKLADLVNPKRPIRYGIVQTGINLNEGVSCIRVVDFNSRQFDKEKMIKTSIDISNSFPSTILEVGDIVFPLRGRIGEVRIVDKNSEGANLTRGIALISGSNKVNPNYLLWQIRSNSVKRKIALEVNGTTLKEIPIGGLKKISVPIPKLEEQIKIARILDGFEEKLGIQIEKKAHYQELKKGLMQQLLTGKVRVIV